MRVAFNWFFKVAAAAALVTSFGCMPTVSMHSYRDVEVALTVAESGRPLAQEPFQVVYTYSPADSPFVYHVELRTPDEVSSETDAQGKAVVKLADYAWDILLYLDDAEEGRSPTGFLLSDHLVRSGGLVNSYNNPQVKLELSPIVSSK